MQDRELGMENSTPGTGNFLFTEVFPRISDGFSLRDFEYGCLNESPTGRRRPEIGDLSRGRAVARLARTGIRSIKT